MAVLKTLARGTIKLLLGLLLLLTGFYLLLLAINWQDAKPNEASLHMQSLLQQDTIPAEQNGYQYLLAHHTNNELILSGTLQQLYHQCHQQDCSEELAAQTDLAELIAEQHSLMAFYQQLLQYSQWQEPPPNHDELPRYQGLLHGQRLFLWQAWLNAQKGNDKQVGIALRSDYTFWKNVLASSNTLITKMISTAAIKQHFIIGQTIIAQLPADQRQAAIPEGWTIAFSDKELGIERALAGEWHLITNAFYIAKQGNDPDFALSDASIPGNIVNHALRPMLLLQDSKNQAATQLFQQAQQNEQTERRWYSWLRNPIGRILMAVGTVPVTDYQQRVLQLEQQRQSLLQQIN